MAKELTDKQQRFVEEYLVDLNATQAAIRAGYSKKSARDIGYENLTKPDIRAAIVEKRTEISRRVDLTIDDVIWGLWSLYEMCCQPIIEFDKLNNPILLPANETGARRSLEAIGRHLAPGTTRIELTGHGGGPIQTEEISERETARLAAYLPHLRGAKTESVLPIAHRPIPASLHR